MQKGSQARPTTDKVRSSIFSILHNVEGARVLDGFAGSGAMGIEAYSRGAGSIDFIDLDTSSLQLNLNLLDKSIYKLYKGDFLKLAPTLCGGYDLIFIDPPYGKYEPEMILNICSKILCETGLIVYEEYFKTDFSRIDREKYNIEKEKRYGDTSVIIFSKK